MSQDDGNNVKWIVGAIIVPIFAAVIAAGVWLPGKWSGPESGSGSGSASIFLSALSGPGGSEVRVSGEGYDPNEEVVIRFHTTEVARTRASAEGKFSNVPIVIPRDYVIFAPHQYDVVATGRESIKSADAAYTISG